MTGAGISSGLLPAADWAHTTQQKLSTGRATFQIIPMSDVSVQQVDASIIHSNLGAAPVGLGSQAQRQVKMESV